MAKWVISRRDTGVNLSHTNLHTNETFDCGDLDVQVPDSWVLDWIFNHADNLCPGDFFQLSSGTTLHFSRIVGRS